MIRTNLVQRCSFAAAMLAPLAICSAVAASKNVDRRVVVSPVTLPQQVGVWQSEQIPLTNEELAVLDSPASCQRIYFDPAGDQVQVLILQVDRNQNAHDPKLCMAGADYRLASDRVVQAPWVGSDKVSRAEFQKDGQTLDMYYWLQTGTGTVSGIGGGSVLASLGHAISGSSLHGISVRLLAMQNRFDSKRTTRPEMVARLWQTVSRIVDAQSLARSMS